MNTMIKISTTELYNKSSVAKAVLMLVSCSSVEALFLKMKTSHKPILISKTEKIEDGDWVLAPNGTILQMHRVFVSVDILKYFKILALPKDFSNEDLQAIADGKIKHEEKLFVECVGYMPQSNGLLSDGKITHEISLDPKDNTLNYIKFDSFHHVIIHRINEPEKKLYTKDEMEEFGREAFYKGREVKMINNHGVLFVRPTYEGYLRELNDKS